MPSFTISGQLIDIVNRRQFPAVVQIVDGIIAAITEIEIAPQQYILPGFIDAHIHIESSMLVPTAFARLAVVHGTVGTVSDPHEIANVCGLPGIHYMIENSRQTPLKIFFGAPSCVPATGFETAGATLDVDAVATLLQSPDISYLSEMMNYPGVLHNDPQVMAKIAAAHKAGKPVDGHAPGLMGQQAAQYAAAGITTDHECVTLQEALDKIAAGMHILIREGSAAKNYEALHPLLGSHPDRVMFCSDDKHPDELVLSHINNLVKRSLQLGYDLFDVLRAASFNPVQHYKLPVGLLRVNDPADFIVVNNLEDLNILQNYIGGVLVAENGVSQLPAVPTVIINNFAITRRQPADFALAVTQPQATIRVIEALEGQLITRQQQLPARIDKGKIVSDTTNDILKMAVINRYRECPPAIAFVKNFGLQRGALASTVAHDCHNIIAVGVDDESICAAVNALIDNKGGIAVATDTDHVHCMPLPVAGLMTTEDGYEIARQYAQIEKLAKQYGTTLKAPFMTLSFMALLVIPSLKLSDKGLFDGEQFTFTSVVV